jgi:hypothetical protein
VGTPWVQPSRCARVVMRPVGPVAVRAFRSAGDRSGYRWPPCEPGRTELNETEVRLPGDGAALCPVPGRCRDRLLSRMSRQGPGRVLTVVRRAHVGAIRGEYGGV